MHLCLVWSKEWFFIVSITKVRKILKIFEFVSNFICFMLNCLDLFKMILVDLEPKSLRSGECT